MAMIATVCISDALDWDICMVTRVYARSKERSLEGRLLCLPSGSWDLYMSPYAWSSACENSGSVLKTENKYLILLVAVSQLSLLRVPEVYFDSVVSLYKIFLCCRR